jgi:hypothetical protein
VLTAPPIPGMRTPNLPCGLRISSFVFIVPSLLDKK